MTGFHVENLGGSITACGDVFAVGGEADAADDAVVLEGMEDGDIELARDVFVEDGEPIFTLTFIICGGGI